MNANEYQRAAMRTRQPYATVTEEAVFAALEMSAEAGEIANLIYKHAFQEHPLDPAKVAEELGDVMWGIACMCDALGLQLGDVLQGNIDKLRRRYPNGWSREASLARIDHRDPSEDWEQLPLPFTPKG